MLKLELLRERALALRALHDRRRVLVLPNAWDVVTARLVEKAGFHAVATSSAAVAWSLGYPDGERIPRDETLAVAARIARAVRVPVTADLEGGYGDPASTVEFALAAGVVGANLEDASSDGKSPLVDVEEAAERIRQARYAADRAGVAFFINARTDVFLRDVGDPASRLEHAIERGNAYCAAGADGIFVPGVEDAQTIAVLAREIPAPLNVLARAITPSVAELERLGVARVSMGSGVAAIALTAVRDAVADVRDRGTFACLGETMKYVEYNGLFTK